jgi:protocadherin-16/23
MFPTVLETHFIQNASIGTSVIQVHATDKDANANALVTYHLLPSALTAQRKQFKLDATTGMISVAEPLTLYTQKSYELLVVARDGGVQPMESTTFVQVRVYVRYSTIYDPTYR